MRSGKTLRPLVAALGLVGLVAFPVAAPAANPAPRPAVDILPAPPRPLYNINTIRPAEPQPSQGQHDPLGLISNQMGDVTHDLGDHLTGKPVQDEQTQIVRGLDQIIAMIEEQMKKSTSSGRTSPSPSRPMTDSRLVGGPGGIGDLHDPRAGHKSWGTLPPKQREQILQSRTEGFPAGYEGILESYYYRLSQDQAPAPAAADGAPGKQPSSAKP